MSAGAPSSTTTHSTTVATARKEFFHDQVRESFNDGAPGVVGEINRSFSSMSHACIDRLPSDRYAVHGDRHMVLALTLLEQAKDAAVRAVILTGASAPGSGGNVAIVNPFGKTL